VVTDPLYALSCARTALDDPGALPESQEARVHAVRPFRLQTPSADPAHTAYAIEQIDAVMAELCLDPVEDAGVEAHRPLATLRDLIVEVANELDAADRPNPAVPHIRNAAAFLAEALAVVKS
jgi:hypothetical protein